MPGTVNYSVSGNTHEERSKHQHEYHTVFTLPLRVIPCNTHDNHTPPRDATVILDKGEEKCKRRVMMPSGSFSTAPILVVGAPPPP